MYYKFHKNLLHSLKQKPVKIKSLNSIILVQTRRYLRFFFSWKYTIIYSLL